MGLTPTLVREHSLIFIVDYFFKPSFSLFLLLLNIQLVRKCSLLQVLLDKQLCLVYQCFTKVLIWLQESNSVTTGNYGGPKKIAN